MNQQTFSLTLSAESFANLPKEAQELCTTIRIHTSIQLIDSQLIFTYQIDMPAGLQPNIRWQSFNQHAVQPKDYLWEDSCLECFIGQQDTESYVEINACPCGSFAVYHFDSYRSPNSLPPRALTVNDKAGNTKKAIIHWHKMSHDSELNQEPTHSTNALVRFLRSFSFDSQHLPADLSNFDLLHPCVILYYDKTPLFFASQHSTPADFHQRKFWQQTTRQMDGDNNRTI